jgi:hypothetical protein
VEVISRTRGTNSQKGESEGAHCGKGIGKSRRERRNDEDGEPDSYVSEQDVDGTSTTMSRVAGETESETVSQTLIPIMGEEVAEYFSLDEQLAMFEQTINLQDNREYMVRLASMKAPVAMRTLDMPRPYVNTSRLDAYIQKRFRSLPYALRLDEARHQSR